jgi:hypothetical protein
MGKMEEYDKFLDSVRDKILLRKAINQTFNKSSRLSNFLPSSLGKIKKEIQAKESVFYEFIKQLKAEGVSQEELDLLIETNKQKSSEALDERIEIISKILNESLPKEVSNKSSIHRRMQANSQKFIIEFVTPNKGNIVNKKGKSSQKVSAKWHALHYLLEMDAKGLKIPVNREGSFVKTEIEEIGKERIGGTGQSFYRQVLLYKDDIKDSSKLEKSLGKGWKEKMIDIFKDDELLIDYLNTRY